MGFIDNPPYVSRESLPTRIAAMRWWFWLQKVMQGFDRMLSFVPARGVTSETFLRNPNG
ncbi:hypothetical protein [Accumulibacter sp.]|uniref:hypothetical protein n=1 Tax=Accumulibacter sp. TaxID=2053492 RepID=UPI0035AFA535